MSWRRKPPSVCHQMPRRYLAVPERLDLIIDRPDRAFDLVVGNNAFFATAVGIGDRHSCHQLLGIVMLPIAANSRSRADFDNLTEIHDGDAMADALDDGHVMRDEQE